jgi:hypothetical protein
VRVQQLPGIAQPHPVHDTDRGAVTHLL